MNHTHLSDDRLIEVCLAADDRQAAEWSGCASCQSRHAALAHLLADVQTAAAMEADAAFPADRLARQKARILQRLEADGRPGRLITFPASSHPHELSMRRTRPASRWIAAAAAAAFVVGLLAGHLVHSLPGAPIVQSRSAAVPVVARQFRTLSAVVASDDEFLGQIELAAGRTSPAPLVPLDVLTPRAWEVR